MTRLLGGRQLCGGRGGGGGAGGQDATLTLARARARALTLALTPSLPRLALLHRRRAHFEEQARGGASFDPAKLKAAVREEQQASHGRGGRALLALLAGAQRLLFGGAWAALWRFLPRGGQPAVPEWHAEGRTEEDERTEAVLDAEAAQAQPEPQPRPRPHPISSHPIPNPNSSR